jgi:Ser/Thr protein kinase RdoA (MazF antagonist)
VNDILTQIAQIAGDLPTLNDIRTPARWLPHGLAITEDLRALVAGGSCKAVHAALIDQVSAHIHSSIVLAAINGPTGYVHTDLRDENVFVLADGYRILDWQRPIWGPIALDRATMLESVGVDPVQHVSVGVLQLRTLLMIGWYAQTARHWFPAGATWYDAEIAQLVKQLETRQCATPVQSG